MEYSILKSFLFSISLSLFLPCSLPPISMYHLRLYQHSYRLGSLKARANCSSTCGKTLDLFTEPRLIVKLSMNPRLILIKSSASTLNVKQDLRACLAKLLLASKWEAGFQGVFSNEIWVSPQWQCDVGSCIELVWIKLILNLIEPLLVNNGIVVLWIGYVPIKKE